MQPTFDENLRVIAMTLICAFFMTGSFVMVGALIFDDDKLVLRDYFFSAFYLIGMVVSLSFLFFTIC